MVPPDAQPQPTPDDLRREHERELSRIRNRRYYAKRRLEIRAERSSPEWLAYRKRYYESNRATILAQQAATMDRARKSETDRRYREAHKEELAAKKAADHAANRERRKALMAARYRTDPARSLVETRAWRKANPEKVFASYAKRRALAGGSDKISLIVRQVIYDRDKGICGICGELAERPPNRKTTLDHIVPLAQGGPHTPENLQVAHRTCNCRKHARTMEEFLAAQAV